MTRLYYTLAHHDTLEFLALVEEECGGMRRHMFQDQCAANFRLGQAFVNALRGTKYYDQLSGSLYDPFYKDDQEALSKALDFLTTKEF